MVGIDQSCVGSGDKAHKDETKTARTALLSCRIRADCSSAYALATHDSLATTWGQTVSRVGMSSSHLEATGMQHHTVTVSPWVTGVQEPLSCLYECRISKSKAPDQTLQQTIIPRLATLASPSKQPTAAGRLGGCVRRAVERLNDILKTTDKSGWS